MHNPHLFPTEPKQHPRLILILERYNHVKVVVIDVALNISCSLLTN